MADTAADHAHGEMDASAQRSTYRAFNTLLHWAALLLAALLSFLTLWLCAHAGFLTGLVVAIVILVIGTWWLRRPKSH